MIALGVWQLQRRDGKEALIERYSQAQAMSSAVEWPRDFAGREAALFRHSRVNCERVLARGAVAGHSATGETGWAQTATCAIDGGGEAEVVARLGARSPRRLSGRAARSLGFVAPGADEGARLIASPPLAGLAAQRPSRSARHAQQPSGLCGAMVRLRADRGGDLCAGGAQAPCRWRAAPLTARRWNTSPLAALRRLSISKA